MVESAFIGHPPATEEDFYIVKSYLRLASKYSGKFNADPTKGIAPGMKPPPGYVYHDKQAGILVALSVMLVFIFFLTATRLSLRLFVQRLKWGPDDWAIIPATVRRTPPDSLRFLTDSRYYAAWHDDLSYSANPCGYLGWRRKTVWTIAPNVSYILS